MKHWILAASLLILTALVVGCVHSQARKGQRLFAGCLDKVDDKATLETGLFVCTSRLEATAGPVGIATFRATISGSR